MFIRGDSNLQDYYEEEYFRGDTNLQDLPCYGDNEQEEEDE